jgi:4-hydroxybenzoate polyprenyltransferase
MVKKIDLILKRPHLRSFIVFNLPTFIYLLFICGSSDPKFIFIPKDFVLLSISFIIYVVSGYLINDFFDYKNDFILNKINLRNEWGSKKLIIVFFVLEIIGFFVARLVDYQIAWILLFQFVILFLYSSKGIRIKERGFLGVIFDATYAHVIPSLIIIVYLNIKFNILPFFSLVFFSVSLGIRDIIRHQISDLEDDLRTSQRTFSNQNHLLAKRVEKVMSSLNVFSLFLFQIEILIRLDLHLRLDLFQCFNLILVLFVFTFVLIKHNKNYGNFSIQFFVTINSIIFFVFHLISGKSIFLFFVLHPYFVNSLFLVLRYIIVYLVNLLALLTNYILFGIFFLFGRDLRKYPIYAKVDEPRWLKTILTLLKRI